ncbi:MAG TPA: peroxiredoxin [Candidatus Dormibacteraeota bacterium]|nr:peroxiredoxin [Candidatus Dormibacteraeota bacterium]
MLEPGDAVPDFSLSAGTGETVATAGMLGKRWVIYFYPKDNTPGCTIETREFGQALGDFSAHGVRVFGCSVGDVQAKAEFATACGAPDLPLLADPDHQVAELFGVWQTGPDRATGRVGRATFLVDAQGKVERVWDAVTPAGHAAAVLEAVG